MDSAPFLFAYSEENTDQTDADFREKFFNGDDLETTKNDEGSDAAGSLTYAATAAFATSAFLLY